MKPHQVFDDRQPEAGARGLARALLVDLEEPVEYLFATVPRDPDPVVLDEQRGPFAIPSSADPNLAAQPLDRLGQRLSAENGQAENERCDLNRFESHVGVFSFHALDLTGGG